MTKLFDGEILYGSPEKLLVAAREALNDGKLERARNLAMAVVEDDPDNMQAWLILGHTTISQEEVDYCYQRAQKLIPSDEKAGLESLLKTDTLEAGMEVQSYSFNPRTTTIKRGQKNQLGIAQLGPVEPIHRIQPNINSFNGLLSKITSHRNKWFWPMSYFLGLTLAEGLTILIDSRIGLSLHAVILLTLLLHGSVAKHVQIRRFLYTLALAPLLRLLSLSLPLWDQTLTYRYLVVGALLSIAVFITSRMTGLRGSRIGITLKAWPLQFLIGVMGFGLGLVEYYILRPDPLINELNLKTAWLPALILLVFTGFVEEVVFRGLIQQASIEWLGRFGFVFVALLFAIMHLGYRSMLDVLFVFFVGLAFGLIVRKTGSLLGVSLAHGLTNICLYLIFPFLL